MDHFRIYEAPYPKKRIGSTFDGGYVICDIPGSYDLILGGGVGRNISFEDGLLQMYPSLQAVVFDGTVDDIPSNVRNKDRITFVKKNLGATITESQTNLVSYFADHSDIFMKMDIEGGEFSLFPSITDDDLLKIKQLVIEFHSGLFRESNMNIFKRIAKTHWLVHLHPNNCCGTRDFNGLTIPYVFECTFIRKSAGDTLNLNSRPIPDPDLDQPNLRNRPDISLSGEPYITSIN
jgi:hypothetical protein